MDRVNQESPALRDNEELETRKRASEVVGRCCRSGRMETSEEFLIDESLNKRRLGEEEIAQLLFENDGQGESWDRVKSKILEFLNRNPYESKRILELASEKFGWPFNIQIRSEKEVGMKIRRIKSPRLVRYRATRDMFVGFGRLWADTKLIGSQKMSGIKRQRVYAQTAGNLLRKMVEKEVHGDSGLVNSLLELPVLEKQETNYVSILKQVRKEHDLAQPLMRWFMVGDEYHTFHVVSLQSTWNGQTYTSQFYAASTKDDAINLAARDLLLGLKDLPEIAETNPSESEKNWVQTLRNSCEKLKAKLTWRFSPAYHTVAPPHLCVCKVTLEDGSKLFAFGSKPKRKEALRVAAQRMLQKPEFELTSQSVTTPV